MKKPLFWVVILVSTWLVLGSAFGDIQFISPRLHHLSRIALTLMLVAAVFAAFRIQNKPIRAVVLIAMFPFVFIGIIGLVTRTATLLMNPEIIINDNDPSKKSVAETSHDDGKIVTYLLNFGGVTTGFGVSVVLEKNLGYGLYRRRFLCGTSDTKDVVLTKTHNDSIQCHFPLVPEKSIKAYVGP